MDEALNRFNWIAPFYHRLTRLVFGDALLNAQIEYLDVIKGNKSVLVIGGGSGEFLDRLLKRSKTIRVTYLEASDKMLELSKRKVGENTQVKFIHGNEDSIIGAKFDIIITNFFLDIFTNDQLGNIVPKLSTVLNAEGHWIVTDFQDSKKIHHRILLRSMFVFFRTMNSIDSKYLPDWKAKLKLFGFELVMQKTFFSGFVLAQLYQRQNH